MGNLRRDVRSDNEIRRRRRASLVRHLHVLLKGKLECEGVQASKGWNLRANDAIQADDTDGTGQNTGPTTVALRFDKIPQNDVISGA